MQEQAFFEKACLVLLRYVILMLFLFFYVVIHMFCKRKALSLQRFN